MKILPSAVRIAAIAGLALIFAGAAFIFFEGTTRLYLLKPTDLTDHAAIAGMWGMLIIAGIALSWRDRIEQPDTERSQRKQLRVATAFLTAAVCAAIAAAGFFSAVFITALPHETSGVWSNAALPAGFALAAILSALRAIEELRA
jgi:drug/metabolite transporter (DMT)-like permease